MVTETRYATLVDAPTGWRQTHTCVTEYWAHVYARALAFQGARTRVCAVEAEVSTLPGGTTTITELSKTVITEYRPIEQPKQKGSTRARSRAR